MQRAVIKTGKINKPSAIKIHWRGEIRFREVDVAAVSWHAMPSSTLDAVFTCTVVVETTASILTAMPETVSMSRVLDVAEAGQWSEKYWKMGWMSALSQSPGRMRAVTLATISLIARNSASHQYCWAPNQWMVKPLGKCGSSWNIRGGRNKTSQKVKMEER